jgi:hypothetical protein
MRIRCTAANEHLIYTMTRLAWFWWETLLETLSSPLEGKQIPWLSSWSHYKRTTHLFLSLSSSRRILGSCASHKSPTSPFGSSSTGNHTKLYWGKVLWNDWSSVQRDILAVESQLPEDRKLATGTSSRLNSVPCIPLMLHLSGVGIKRSSQ